MTEFSLNEKEEKKLKKWQNAIKEIYGEYGSYSFTFTPTGIGTGISVYSKLVDKELDITDLDSW